MRSSSPSRTTQPNSTGRVRTKARSTGRRFSTPTPISSAPRRPPCSSSHAALHRLQRPSEGREPEDQISRVVPSV